MFSERLWTWVTCAGPKPVRAGELGSLARLPASAVKIHGEHGGYDLGLDDEERKQVALGFEEHVGCSADGAAATECSGDLGDFEDFEAGFWVVATVALDAARDLPGSHEVEVGDFVLMDYAGVVEVDGVGYEVGAVFVVEMVSVAVGGIVDGGYEALVLLAGGSDPVSPESTDVGGSDSLPPLVGGNQ